MRLQTWMASLVMGLGLAISLGAPSAQAAKTGFELDGGLTIFTETDTVGITGRGSFVLPLLGPFFVAPEAEGSFGLFGQEGGVETERTVAGFARGGFSLGDRVDLHGRLGFQQTRISVDTGFGEATSGDGAFAWGVGGAVWIRENLGIRGDYTRSDGRDQIGVTAAFRF